MCQKRDKKFVRTISAPTLPEGFVMTMRKLVDVLPKPPIDGGTSTRLQRTWNVPFQPHPETVKLLSASKLCLTSHLHLFGELTTGMHNRTNLNLSGARNPRHPSV